MSLFWPLLNPTRFGGPKCPFFGLYSTLHALGGQNVPFFPSTEPYALWGANMSLFVRDTSEWLGFLTPRR